MVVVNTTNNTCLVGHQTDRVASPMVTLVTAEACHLCEDAHTELLEPRDPRAATARPGGRRITAGPGSTNTARPCSLVLLDGAFLSAGRLPRRKLDRALAARKAS